MHKVYRIEHKDKVSGESPIINVGCYNGIFSLRHSMNTHHINSGSRPSIRLDIKGWKTTDRYDGNYFCCCPTLDSLNKWFYKWKTKLLKEGYVVVEYTVTRSLKGLSGNQSIFHPRYVKEKKIVQTRYGYIN